MPKDLREELHRDAPDSDTLDRLADGQMLCLAYNAVLRKSQKPWGFIPQNSIHDVISLARERKKSEQLQYHDTVPAEGSSHLSVRGGGGSSSLMRRASSEGLSGDDSSTINAGSGIGKSTRIGLTFRRFENLRVFIAALKLRYLIQVRDGINVKTIARKEEGWRDMLLEIAFSWVEAAAEEKRNEDIQSD